MRMKEMSFMSKKKRFKFSAKVEVDQLEAIAFVSGTLVAKARLVGGSYSDCSNRAEIKNHCVKWGHAFEFSTKITANPSTGVLDPCLCRLSVRKELKGGRSYQKLGYADINLSEFASPGPAQSRRYLLEGYSDKTRQDNSLLRVTVGMTRVSGELLYKVPQPSNHQLQDPAAALPGEPDINLNPAAHGGGRLPSIGARENMEFGGADDMVDGGVLGSEELKAGGSGSVASSSSGFSSLTRKNTPGGGVADFEPSHSRTPSSVSNPAKVVNGLTLGPPPAQPGAYDRGYGSYDKSRGHNRHPSADVQAVQAANHIRHSSLGSARDTNKLVRPPQGNMENEKLGRIDKSRVDANDLVNQLMNGIKFDESPREEARGLQLYIAKDGTAAVGGPGELLSKDYTPVVLDP